MKSKFLVLLLLLVVVFAGFSLAQAATSQLDNMPGGAGYAYWQTNTSWRTLVNIQNTNNAAAYWVDLILFDENSVHLADWQMPLTPNDNTGVIISSTAAGSVNIMPYSVPATFLGAAPAIGIPLTGLTISGVPVGSDGFMKGYLSVVLRYTGVPVSSSQPTLEFPDVLHIRTAYLNGTTSAFALNGAMLQGYVNIGIDNAASGVVAEANREQWLNTVPRPNQRTVCDANMDGAIGATFGRQDASRATIGFWELMLTENIFIPFGTPAGNAGRWRVICDLSQKTYPAMGSAFGRYWARYNVTTGITSSLVLVAPASSSGLDTTPRVGQQVAFPAYYRHIDANAYDDAENPLSTIIDFPEVARIPFGNNAGTDIVINSTAGEARLIVSAPVFGFSYTEGAGGFADIYPLISESKNISVTNITYGFSLGTAINASANPVLQTVTDFGNYYDTPATNWGPWSGLGTPVYWSDPANTYMTQYTYTTGSVVPTAVSQFGVAAEHANNSVLSSDNYTPVSPEIGVLGNKYSTDIAGYKSPTTAYCGWAPPTSGQVCAASNTVTIVAGGTTYYNSCYGICKIQ
ncbi:MAG: hypothetical protein HQL05_03530 [Nitrospirae bacterium]|uniref:hypothetical protein n=1 Tax=Candidatus Magnetobacterium casense TaxID=1455061 RepID=UPI00058C3C13|nr:hypothetical protein [Candidatus Magnetobacterium casensis]MBF0336880.1 hypothetical protein [Nitrospirota bacterium]